MENHHWDKSLRATKNRNDYLKRGIVDNFTHQHEIAELLSFPSSRSSDMMISFKYHVEKNIGQDETVCYEEKYFMEMMKKKRVTRGTGDGKPWRPRGTGDDGKVQGAEDRGSGSGGKTRGWGLRGSGKGGEGSGG